LYPPLGGDITSNKDQQQDHQINSLRLRIQQIITRMQAVVAQMAEITQRLDRLERLNKPQRMQTIRGDMQK